MVLKQMIENLTKLTAGFAPTPFLPYGVCPHPLPSLLAMLYGLKHKFYLRASLLACNSSNFIRSQLQRKHSDTKK